MESRVWQPVVRVFSAGYAVPPFWMEIGGPALPTSWALDLPWQVYGSFWHLSAMMALTSLVAVNYITICRLYPNGGGVYSSVYHRSKLLAVVGALLLAADYIVTMALSVLDACHYFGLSNPVLWAIVVILAIGALTGSDQSTPAGWLSSSPRSRW